MKTWIVKSMPFAVLVVGVAALAWACAAHPPSSSSDWAAWAQAFGAILAILATGWAVNHSHTLTADKARAEAKAEDIRKLASIASSIFHCRAHAESLRRYNAYTANLDGLTETLTRQVHLLQSIGILEIPDWRASIAVAQTIAVYDQLAAKLRSEAKVPYSQHVRDGRDVECRRAITRFKEFERMVQGTLIERGADVPQQEVDYADGTVASLSVLGGDRTFAIARTSGRDDGAGLPSTPVADQQ